MLRNRLEYVCQGDCFSISMQPLDGVSFDRALKFFPWRFEVQTEAWNGVGSDHSELNCLGSCPIPIISKDHLLKCSNPELRVDVQSLTVTSNYEGR